MSQQNHNLERPVFVHYHTEEEIFRAISWGRTLLVIQNPENAYESDVIILSRGIDRDKTPEKCLRDGELYIQTFLAQHRPEGSVDEFVWWPASEEELRLILIDLGFTNKEITEGLHERKRAQVMWHLELKTGIKI